MHQLEMASALGKAWIGKRVVNIIIDTIMYRFTYISKIYIPHHPLYTYEKNK